MENSLTDNEVSGELRNGPHPDCYKTTACGCKTAEDCPMNQSNYLFVGTVESRPNNEVIYQDDKVIAAFMGLKSRIVGKEHLVEVWYKDDPEL